MIRAMVAVLLVGLVMIVQVTVVNRLPLPGGGGPDLVLLVVVLFALARGAVGGAVIGFVIGLAADLLPPSAHVMGQYALVFCLVGYAVGRARERAPGSSAIVVIAAIMLAPLLSAGVGALMGDPRVGTRALAALWPSLVMYNLAVAAAAFWAVSRFSRERPRRKAVPTGAYPVRRRV
ncbi:rod shape-determining protein MreD [Sphaerisporangium sp. TRM90804]|uniref:rod shape-determining protein MreD n=1 Tax=Sphaerisporangium sp. TRM90804 TaxID=3031113 RepID=UPI00244AA38E|nr:rod shape-determining protein MreD [Sphaerisporangium sp. TRM90804]MDH2428122.1 rod shape-determining protein MreD [Sphaerisporangium sp. TRM90804]